jgi:hypothetical protein
MAKKGQNAEDFIICFMSLCPNSSAVLGVFMYLCAYIYICTYAHISHHIYDGLKAKNALAKPVMRHNISSVVLAQ